MERSASSTWAASCRRHTRNTQVCWAWQLSTSASMPDTWGSRWASWAFSAPSSKAWGKLPKNTRVLPVPLASRGRSKAIQGLSVSSWASSR